MLHISIRVRVLYSLAINLLWQSGYCHAYVFFFMNNPVLIPLAIVLTFSGRIIL